MQIVSATLAHVTTLTMMNPRLWILSAALSATLSGCAEDAPKAEQVERLVRNFAFTSEPNLNTDTEFKISKLEVTRLWEELKTHVYDVEYQIKGQRFNGFVGIYHNGKLDFLPTFGGRLKSGLVNNGEFYYTYSWGSVIHRSNVAKLRIVNDKLESSDSGGFDDRDLFVAADPSGKVRVLSGDFKKFNHWDAARDVGFVGKTNSSVLQIVDISGKVITPTFPYRTE